MAHQNQLQNTTVGPRFDHNLMAYEGTAERGGELLTAREREIVRLVAHGLRNREIGGRLAITEGTVKIHLHNIYRKLEVGGRIMLILYAQANRLL